MGSALAQSSGGLIEILVHHPHNKDVLILSQSSLQPFHIYPNHQLLRWVDLQTDLVD